MHLGGTYARHVKQDFNEVEIQSASDDFRGDQVALLSESERGPDRGAIVEASPASNKMGGFDKWLESLPGPVHFSLLCLGVCISFGMHNYLQEAISRMDGFKGLGSILGYLEVMGVMVFSFFERWVVGESDRKVKATAYMQLTACLLGSSYLSTGKFATGEFATGERAPVVVSLGCIGAVLPLTPSFYSLGLDYISYPTKVVFRSCKLIPTMAVAFVYNKESFSVTDISCALAICAGLAMFAFADMSAVVKISTAFGMSLQALSTIADAFLPNLQQKLFKLGASTLEVTYYTNLYVFLLMTLMGGGSGHLQGAVAFVRSDYLSNGGVLLLYSLVAYYAINFHIRIVKSYGSVVGVLVGNFRKAGTIALSFLVFPKPFSWLYVWGAIFVFGGLTITGIVKEQSKRKKKEKEKYKSDQDLTSLDPSSPALPAAQSHELCKAEDTGSNEAGGVGGNGSNGVINPAVPPVPHPTKPHQPQTSS